MPAIRGGGWGLGAGGWGLGAGGWGLGLGAGGWGLGAGGWGLGAGAGLGGGLELFVLFYLVVGIGVVLPCWQLRKDCCFPAWVARRFAEPWPGRSAQLGLVQMKVTMFTLLNAVISSYFRAAAPCLIFALLNARSFAIPPSLTERVASGKIPPPWGYRDLALNRTKADFCFIASGISRIGASQAPLGPIALET